MDSGKLARYQELVQASMQLQERYQEQVGQVDSIADQIAMLTEQRESNTFNQASRGPRHSTLTRASRVPRQEYRALEAQATKLHKQMQGLAEELEISKLEPDEMQKRMLAKVDPPSRLCTHAECYAGAANLVEAGAVG